MSMESFPSREKKPDTPKFSMEEWKQYCGGAADLDGEEQKKWMEEKGIKFDSGIVDVVIDGKKMKMVTAKEDFGTWVDEQEESNH